MRKAIATVVLGVFLLSLYAWSVFRGSKETDAPPPEVVAVPANQLIPVIQEPVVETEQLPEPPAVVPAGVRWRSRPAPALEEYPTTYEELRRLAEKGDGHALAKLSRLLFHCSLAPPPQSDEEIAAVVEEVRRTHRLPVYYEPGVESSVDLNNRLRDLESNIAQYVKRARQCNPVTLKQRAELEEWLLFARSLGATDGLLNLYQAILPGDAYAQFLDEVWQSGDPMALLEIAAYYYGGYRQGTNPKGHILEYAHYLALADLLRDYAGEFDIPSPHNPALIFDNILTERRRDMHAHEIREAEELARAIVGDNSNCCLSFPDSLFSGARQ